MRNNETLARPERLRIAAIRFLNPAPLMWDFEHQPWAAKVADQYSVDWMMPSACAAKLELPLDAPDAADIGLVPVTALATNPDLRILPGCAIAAKSKVRSILLVRRADQQLQAVETVAVDTSSRASVAYLEVIFRQWWNPDTRFLSHPPDLDAMLQAADAALLIGDPALFALEQKHERARRTGETLVYHDLAAEWIALTGLPWVSAVWAVRASSLARTGRTIESLADDFRASRLHGLAHLDELVEHWSTTLALPTSRVHNYLTKNIYYSLDEECIAGLERFYELAMTLNILPTCNITMPEPDRE